MRDTGHSPLQTNLESLYDEMNRVAETLSLGTFVHSVGDSDGGRLFDFSWLGFEPRFKSSNRIRKGDLTPSDDQTARTLIRRSEAFATGADSDRIQYKITCPVDPFQDSGFFQLPDFGVYGFKGSQSYIGIRLGGSFQEPTHAHSDQLSISCCIGNLAVVQDHRMGRTTEI